MPWKPATFLKRLSSIQGDHIANAALKGSILTLKVNYPVYLINEAVHSPLCDHLRGDLLRLWTTEVVTHTSSRTPPDTGTWPEVSHSQHATVFRLASKFSVQRPLM